MPSSQNYYEECVNTHKGLLSQHTISPPKMLAAAIKMEKILNINT